MLRFFSLIFCLLLTQNAYAGDDTEISVMATAQTILPSEEVTITGSVTTQSKDAKSATKENANAIEKIRKFWQTQNFPKDSLTTTTYRVNPMMDYKEGKGNQVTGFEVAHDLRFVFSNKKDVGSVIDGLVGAGLTNIANVSFSAKAKDTIYEELTKEALDSAKKKATLIMEQMNGKNLVLKRATLNENSPPVVMESRMMRMSAKVMDAPTQIMDNGQSVSVRIPTVWEFEK